MLRMRMGSSCSVEGGGLLPSTMDAASICRWTRMLCESIGKHAMHAQATPLLISPSQCKSIPPGFIDRDKHLLDADHPWTGFAKH